MAQRTSQLDQRTSAFGGKADMLHACIAEAYEQQFQDIVEAQPALLARHLALAGFAERAIGFWLKAARKAIGAICCIGGPLRI